MDEARTVYCGNLSESVSEEMLYELFLQAAPLEKVKIPTDREGRQSSFGFVTFKHEFSVHYAMNLLNGIQLFGKAITIKPRQGNNRGAPPRMGAPQFVQMNTFAHDLLALNSLMQQQQLQQLQQPSNDRHGEFNRNSDSRHRDNHKDSNREYRNKQDSPRESYRPKRNDYDNYDNRQRTPKKPYNRRHDDKNRRYQRYS